MKLGLRQDNLEPQISIPKVSLISPTLISPTLISR